ncbi:hypothetical protein [Streptomyces bohaiensis]|uniref:hypothetical protein n=2 Tax=Streptomyces bohaiensis TaxID=1431344 RepID=UPI001ADD936B|nr:hypothetical protein [Streptomyces bohaiensis]
MSLPSRPPHRRVRVTSPQTRIALSRRHRPVQQLLPLPDGTLDDGALAAARATFARQRRLALRTATGLAALLLGLSGLLAALPALDRITVGPVPASWLLLMAASYPMLLVIAALHVRAAERIEDSAAPERHRPAVPGPGTDAHRPGTGTTTGTRTGDWGPAAGGGRP